MHKLGKKIVFASLGLLCTFLAVLGTILPGLPTTIFVIIAIWAFSNSSEKLQAWMMKIPLLRPAIKETHRFQREKTIDIRVKFVSQFFSWGSFIAVTVLLQNILISILVFLAAAGCSIFMFLTPTSKTKKVTHPTISENEIA